MVLSYAFPVVSMTVDWVGAPYCLSGGPSTATNIQETFDLEPGGDLKKV